jgi:hypothetical protein
MCRSEMSLWVPPPPAALPLGRRSAHGSGLLLLCSLLCLRPSWLRHVVASVLAACSGQCPVEGGGVEVEWSSSGGLVTVA